MDLEVCLFQAHRDDEVMCALSLRQLLLKNALLKICVAVNGGSGKLYGQLSSEYFTNLDAKAVAEEVKGIRDQEMQKSIRLLSLNGGRIELDYFGLEDRGWRGGGIVHEADKLESLIRNRVKERNWNALFFPYTPTLDEAPNNWSHPDHFVISQIGDKLIKEGFFADTPVFRYIFSNESYPISRLPDSFLCTWAPEILAYSQEGFAFMNELIGDCYPSQELTLRAIIAQSRSDLFFSNWDATRYEEYLKIGEEGPLEGYPMHEIMFTQKGKDSFSDMFGMPQDTILVKK